MAAGPENRVIGGFAIPEFDAIQARTAEKLEMPRAEGEANTWSYLSRYNQTAARLVDLKFPGTGSREPKISTKFWISIILRICLVPAVAMCKCAPLA